MKPYSEDLRWRVVMAVDSGTPREEAAWRFAVSVPTIERWLRLRRETGGLWLKPVPGSAAVKTAALVAALWSGWPSEPTRRWQSSAPGGGSGPGTG